MYQKYTFYSVLLLLFWTASCFGLADSSNHTVSVKQTDTEVVFYGTLKFSSNDSTSSLFTQAIETEHFDVYQPIVFQIHGNSAAAAQDVNIFIEGSNSLEDSTFENFHTINYFDDVDLFSADGPLIHVINFKIEAKDSLATGISRRTYHTSIAGLIDPAFLCRYIRIEADGQAGNRADVVLKWWLRAKKKDKSRKNELYGRYNVTGGL